MFVFLFEDVTYIPVNEMCVPESKIDPETVNNITWLPLVRISTSPPFFIEKFIIFY